MNGTDILVRINDHIVGSQRDSSRDETTEEIDNSSKDSRAKRVLPGRYGSTFSLDQLYTPTDNAYLELQAAMRNGTQATLIMMEDGVITESAQVIITSISESYPDQAEAVCSVAGTIDGEWIAGT